MSSPSLIDMANRTGPMAKLSTEARKEMPKADFALPGKGEGAKGSGAGSYPIPNASHARNALARVSQHGSPEEKAEVRAAVHRKFPDIGKSDDGPKKWRSKSKEDDAPAKDDRPRMARIYARKKSGGDAAKPMEGKRSRLYPTMRGA
jgi:hypothetical protein